MVQDYDALLAQAISELPENMGNRGRWSIPPAEVMKEGRMTILRNFGDMVKEFRRDPEHLGKYLLSAIATAGQIDGDRLVFTGAITDNQVNGRVRDYVATYVQCIECGSPDTKLVREDRVQLLSCEACGARTPVKARKAQSRMDKDVLREGAEVEVTIERQGQRGEGMASRDGFTVIVPKTPKGETVRVKIVRMSGKLAFGERI